MKTSLNRFASIFLSCAVWLHATETENNDFSLLPAPGKVVIDGQFADWDLSGSLFICSDVENYRDQFSSWQSAMVDSEYLYLLSRWSDTTPMNNPGLPGADHGWSGDALQVRVIVNPSGTPNITQASDAEANQKTTHITAWAGREDRHIVGLAYGKTLKDGEVKDALEQGAKQAFSRNADGKGYVQEIAIPWTLLTVDGKTPKAGDSIVMTYEPNFGTASKRRITTKDLFREGVVPDRVFAFSNYPRWGVAKVEAGSRSKLPVVRLADGRKFPVTLENGLPEVNWDGLYKGAELEGFVKIPLMMPEDGFVSVVIRDSSGKVVRNLLNAQFLTKGSHEVLWDGLTTPSDRQPGSILAAGNYTWDALWHKGLDLSLVGWASNSGRSPFDSPGGNWGGDHGVPAAVDVNGRGIFLGWSGSEAGKGLVHVNFKGDVLWRHKRGGFGGATLVAADAKTVFVYDPGQGNVLYRLDAAKGEYVNWTGTKSPDLELGKLLANYTPASGPGEKDPQATGIALIKDKLVVSYGGSVRGRTQPSGDMLLVLDAATGKLLKEIKTPNPGDLKLGADKKLYLVSSGTAVSTVNIDSGAVTPVLTKLESVRSATADKDGNLYVGLRDPDNQVKVFDASGTFLRAIGKAGGRPLLGPWQKDGVRFIASVQIDSKGKLWIAESDDSPKRISVWDSLTGAFEKEFFGPTAYGAPGGAVCPADPAYILGDGCEWKIDSETGKADCVAVVFRESGESAFTVRFGTGKDGRTYAAVGGSWKKQDPVRIFERLGAADWKLRTTVSTEQTKERAAITNATVWSDQNDDQEIQENEVKKFDLSANPLGGWISGWYLYFNQAMTFTAGQFALPVAGWTKCGAPEYDFAKASKLPAPADLKSRSGMGVPKGLLSEDGTVVIYNGHYGKEHSDFAAFEVRTGKPLFNYPNNYVGVHGGHKAPPARTGLIRGAYGVLGTMPLPQPIGDVFFIGTDKGEWHILTSSGHYLSKLFEGDPIKIQWPDQVIPGANMNTVPPGMGAEDFGGSVTRANNGSVYVQHGKTAFINSRLLGLDKVKSLGSGKLALNPGDEVKSQELLTKYLSVSDSLKTAAIARKSVTFAGAPEKDFAAKAVVSFGPPTSAIQSWIARDDTTLFVAWKVTDPTPWVNGSSGFENLYAGGDTVDLQLGLDATADPKRREAVKGDLRLSIGRLGGKDTAVLYRKVSDEKAPKTFYSGTRLDGYTLDYVKALEGVRIETKIDQGKGYVVEAAIPLKLLGMDALKSGDKIRGDFGATFSDPEGKDTNLRVHWSNQATGLVADEVEELRLQPSLWGEFKIE